MEVQNELLEQFGDVGHCEERITSQVDIGALATSKRGVGSGNKSDVVYDIRTVGFPAKLLRNQGKYEVRHMNTIRSQIVVDITIHVSGSSDDATRLVYQKSAMQSVNTGRYKSRGPHCSPPCEELQFGLGTVDFYLTLLRSRERLPKRSF